MTDKFEKYLHEGIRNPSKKTMELVREVSRHIDYRGDKAGEFIYLLLEDINFHSEAEEIYDILVR